MSPELTLDTAQTLDKLQSLAAAAAAHHQVGDAHFLVLPEDFTQTDITSVVQKLLPRPARKAGTITLNDIDSFIRYCGDQKLAVEGYVYADVDAATLTAVFNDHGGDAGWRDFRATYKVEKSRELATWLGANKKQMGQEEFAIFLEDNVADIVEPSGEQMLAMALTMQAKVDVSFSSSKRLDNGQIQLSYTETIDARAAGGSIEIPREFSIGVRLFKNGQGYKLRARLKYRLGSGSVKFWYELDRPENATDEAFAEYVERVRDAGYAVLIGKA